MKKENLTKIVGRAINRELKRKTNPKKAGAAIRKSIKNFLEKAYFFPQDTDVVVRPGKYPCSFEISLPLPNTDLVFRGRIKIKGPVGQRKMEFMKKIGIIHSEEDLEII